MAKEMQRTEKITKVTFTIEGVEQEAILIGHLEKEKAFVELVNSFQSPLDVLKVEHETYRYTMPVEQFKQMAKVEKI